MNPLNPQTPTVLQLLLQTPFTWAAAFTPYVILIVCVIALIIMAAVPLVKKEARELDEILDFRSPTSDNKNQKERTRNERTLIHRKPS